MSISKGLCHERSGFGATGFDDWQSVSDKIRQEGKFCAVAVASALLGNRRMSQAGFVGSSGALRHIQRQSRRLNNPRNLQWRMMSTPVNSSKSWKLESAVGFLPHPSKAAKGGEDAYFVLDTAVGVFDGVGGWASKGIDPGLYSRKLASLTEKQVREGGELSKALDTAHTKNDLQGSTTACVARIEDGKLSIVNIGDSGLIAIRPHQGIYFKTPDQQHYFNCPFQLGSTFEDRVKDGITGVVPVEAGDYLLMATDGLLDNLHDMDIELLVKNLHRETQGKLKLSDLANILAKRAQTFAVQDKYWSPFAANASKYGYSTLGGKLDDITIIVSRPVIAN